MVNGSQKRRVLNLPKGKASTIPTGSVVRKGLRGKRPLAQRIVKRSQFEQRTGKSAGSTFGLRRQNKRTAKNISSNLLGFRMDGRGA